MLLGLNSYDNSGLMKEFLMKAMDMRGEEQLALKFGDVPLMQAMGVLGGKFMHEGCFSDSHFGPILQTYSQECLNRKYNPSAPYILSIISSHFDTSTGSSASERDLYSIKCQGKSDQHLRDFISQVDYTMSQMNPSAIPSERKLFEFFYHEVQTIHCIKRHVDKIRDTTDELDPKDEASLDALRHFTTFRGRVVKELGWIQRQKVDVEVQDGVKTLPTAVAERRAKTEAEKVARKEKQKVERNDDGGSARLREWSSPRPGMVAGSIGAPSANNADDSIPAQQTNQQGQDGKGTKGEERKEGGQR